MTGLFGAIQFMYYPAYSIIIGYATVYLLDRGFSNTLVGTVIAVAALAAALLQPVAAAISDRFSKKSVKTIVIIETAVFMGLVLLILATENASIPVIGFVYGAAIMMLQVMTPFINSLGSLSIKAGVNINFGAARGMGSLAYAGTSYILGRVIGLWGLRTMITLALPVAAILMVLFIVFPFHPLEEDDAAALEGEGQTVSLLGFFAKYKAFTVALIGTILMYICHMATCNFAIQIIETKGGGNAELGIALGIASLGEFPVMLIFNKYKEKMAPETWMIIAGLVYTFRCIGSIVFKPLFSFYILQAFHMFSWGIMAVATVYYVSCTVKLVDEVKGQSYFTMAFSVGTVLACLIGGVILDQSGVTAMLLMCAIAAFAGTALIFISKKMQKPQQGTATESISQK